MHLVKMSFNNNYWEKPSGLNGKCRSWYYGTFFEWQFGFGWEEWSFSKSRILEDGYQYGFLQAVNNDDGLRNKLFTDVALFTSVCREGENPKSYIIGYIKELETLSYNKSRIAREMLNQKGVLVQMEQDVTMINGDIKIFNDNLNSCINIRFKPENLKLFWGKVDSSILQINLSSKFSFKDIFSVNNIIEASISNILEKFII